MVRSRCASSCWLPRAFARELLGSVLAMVLALHFGLNVTFFCGALAYALAGLLTPVLHLQVG